MGSKSDKAKGPIKEAVGVLADDDRLKREGQRDQAVGEVKGTVEKAAQQVKGKVKRAAEKVQETAKRTVEKVKDA